MATPDPMTIREPNLDDAEEEWLELRLQESTSVGEATAYSDAAGILLKEAKDYFAQGKDDYANLLRGLSNEMKRQSKLSRDKQNNIRRQLGEREV